MVYKHAKRLGSVAGTGLPSFHQSALGRLRGWAWRDLHLCVRRI